ncbi:hypothetical protein STSP_02800 [Streptomyces jeddahensis]|uniref:Uncharacterized protein n=1 Tax=Streptomyces jeddahensis TaxID=1716141 RepID=A0A177I050_9ACTN|nr:hypothetical protein STSP_02800 [Streptomyces jeddahensis]
MLPIDKRVDDLLGRLTLDERIALLHQYAPPVERLGIASLRTVTEALHGVSWLGEARGDRCDGRVQPGQRPSLPSGSVTMTKLPTLISRLRNQGSDLSV